MESRKAIRKRLVKQNDHFLFKKSIGVTTVLASTSGVFTTLVNAPEANATGVNETEVAKSTKSTATTTLARSSETTINRQFKTTASLNVRSDASTSARIINGGEQYHDQSCCSKIRNFRQWEHDVVQVVIWGLDLWRLCNNRQQQQLFQQQY